MTDVIVGWGWGRDSWGDGAWGDDLFPGLMVGSVGTVGVGIGVTQPVTGVVGTGQLGIALATTPLHVPVTGVQAVGAVGTIASVHGTANVYPDGVEGVGKITSVLVWGQVDEHQTPNWTPIDIPESDIWTPIPKTGPDIWTPIVT